jgi:hypothetical protein
LEATRRERIARVLIARSLGLEAEPALQRHVPLTQPTARRLSASPTQTSIRARAAGSLIEFERGRPIIVDRLLCELVKGAIKRTHDDLEAKTVAVAREKKSTRGTKAPADPVKVAKRDRDAQLRELADQAHGANLDLGVSLMHNLAVVDPADISVARFFALCGRRHSTNYTTARLCRHEAAPFSWAIQVVPARSGPALTTQRA